MAAMNINEITDALAAMKLTTQTDYDLDLDHEVQTDKERVKLLPCRECRRPLVVTTFFAPAKAICATCKGEGGPGEVAIPVAGQTDPKRVADLTKTLVNSHFARAVCPVHPDDESHEMVLKYVHHNPAFGPSDFMGYNKGVAVYRQRDVGETVMHQCSECKACVTYTTTAQVQFGKINKPGKGKSINGMIEVLGMEDEKKVA